MVFPPRARSYVLASNASPDKIRRVSEQESREMEESTNQMDVVVDWIDGWLGGVIPGWEGNVALQATVLIVLSVVIAKIADWVLTAVLRRWARRTRSDFDDRVLAILHNPIFVSVLVFGLWLTARRLDLPERIRYVTFGILASLVIVLWFFALIRLASEVLGATADSGRLAFLKRETLPLFDNLAKIVLFGVATYLLIQVWGADVTGWLASAGIVGIALGFAARDTLANLFSGVFIMADAPYKVGDFINLDTGERGQVTDIGLRSTRLITRDDVEITIPNSVIGNAKIVNESGGPSPNYRLRVKVGVAYGSDIDRVGEVLLAVAADEELVCPEPTPRVRFRSFGDSALEHELLCWVAEPVLRGKALHRLNGEIYRRFEREGIEIPFPKRDVYVRELPSSGEG
jgi:small-conductance mechanosensitive channel